MQAPEVHESIGGGEITQLAAEESIAEVSRTTTSQLSKGKRKADAVIDMSLSPSGPEELALKFSHHAESLTELTGLLGQDREKAVNLHSQLREALGDIGTSYAAKKLNPSQIKHIREIEEYIHMTSMAINFSNSIPDQFRSATEMPHQSRRTKSAANKAIAVGEAFLAMALKNGAWYLPVLAVPGKKVSFHDGPGMAKLIATRSVVGAAAAAILEYIPATDSQRRYAEAGGSLNNWVGIAQSFDMLTAFGILGGISKATGEKFNGYDAAGFAGSGIAAAVQSGWLNGLVTKKTGELRTDGFIPIAAFPQETGQEVTPDGEEFSDVDMEAGGLPLAAQARQQAKALRNLPEGFPGKEFEEMQNRMTDAYEHIGSMQDAMAQIFTSPIGESSPVGESSSVNRAATPNPEMFLETPSEVHLERLNQDLLSVDSNLKALKLHLESLPNNADKIGQLADINQVLKSLDESKNELAKTGGMDPKAKMFFGAMAVMFVAGTVMGNVGPSMKNKALSNINTRAVIIGVTSSIAQAFANLGQFLPVAKPDDPMWRKVLSFGADNPDDSGMMKKIKGWGRAVRFLVAEFPLIQMANTYSEKGLQLAGKIPEAPDAIFPSAANIRNIQEAARSMMSLLFVGLALGGEIKKHHVLGTAISALSAAGMFMWQLHNVGKM